MLYNFFQKLWIQNEGHVVKQSEKRRRKQDKENRMHGKLNRISLGVPSFYRKLQKIFMDDHPQVTIVIHNLIFYNTPP